MGLQRWLRCLHDWWWGARTLLMSSLLSALSCLYEVSGVWESLSAVILVNLVEFPTKLFFSSAILLPQQSSRGNVCTVAALYSLSHFLWSPFLSLQCTAQVSLVAVSCTSKCLVGSCEQLVYKDYGHCTTANASGDIPCLWVLRREYLMHFGFLSLSLSYPLLTCRVAY